MFDNPRRELAKLQERLLESDEPSLEQLYEDDADTALDEMKELLRQSDWEEEEREPLCQSYSQEVDNDFSMFEEEAPLEPEKTEKPKKKGGFIFAVLVEFLGIATLLAWWLLWER